MGPNFYTYSNKKSDYERREQLVLWYEINGSPMSDDYTTDEADADELLRQWAMRYGDTEDGFQSIHWFVTTPEVSGTFEGAPFDTRALDMPNFLTYFTWPVDDDGEPLNWMTLPVLDLGWRRGKADKDGFIQEATGWKPAALQDRVFVRTLLDARG